MSVYVTPYDWLVFAGVAVNTVAFVLLFGRKP